MSSWGADNSDAICSRLHNCSVWFCDNPSPAGMNFDNASFCIDVRVNADPHSGRTRDSIKEEGKVLITELSKHSAHKQQLLPESNVNGGS